MKQINYPITSIRYTATLDDGSTEEREVIDSNLGSIKWFIGSDSDQTFWVASDHAELMNKTHAVASPVGGQDIPETCKDWQNTLTGMIKDGHGTVLYVYDGGEPGLKIVDNVR